MNWQAGESVWICTHGLKLEGRCWGPAPGNASTIILLHEGLGSVGLWKDFPAKLAAQTGYGVFAYSRLGYGNSDPAPLPRPLDYMTREALEVLPQVLDNIGFESGILLGHSDGASIAAIYAGNVVDFRVRGLCLISPHFFTEPAGLAAIAQAKISYETTDLSDRLAKYHADPDGAFRGWNDAWLDPGFKSWNIEEVIENFQIPVLAIQGREDQYGSAVQLDALKNGMHSALEVEILDHCKHSPHLELCAKTLSVIDHYVKRLDQIATASVEVA